MKWGNEMKINKLKAAKTVISINGVTGEDIFINNSSMKYGYSSNVDDRGYVIGPSSDGIDNLDEHGYSLEDYEIDKDL